MSKINRILVANRGEIALRIMKTIRRMGLQSIAIYSEADARSPHVLFADEAVCIGPAPVAESYLRGEEIIVVAKRLRADAIHPGYGFLSENAAFASLVEQAGLVFIGPDSQAISIMGDKLASKAAVKEFGIPMVPGTDEAISTVEEALRVAGEIGFPVLIKASAGGGGKGMRVVEDPSNLEEEMLRATNEAKAAFGNGAIFIEKFIASPRHIEVQVLADQFGNTVHLFERECSIQRRNQKVVEEAPSPFVTPELRRQMGDAAIQVARACKYKSAGTVEFLVDKNRSFYFLEMNTRLQVEHPVTEFITGLDLVEEQIKIASGERLSFGQDDLQMAGHAIELRVMAEDVWNGFAPDTGTIRHYQIPKGRDVRVDDGVMSGSEVSVYYDSMLAKLIVYGKDRASAIQSMLEAIDGYIIEGIHTTLPFGHFVCTHPAFKSGDFNTSFIAEHFDSEKAQAVYEERAAEAARVALRAYLEESKKLKLPLH